MVYFPDRLSTRFRLEFLQRADAVEALLKPVVPFGVTFQRDAAERLVEDLRQVTTWRDGKPENRTGLYVEPMYLQVVGVNLWKADRPDPAQITVQDVAIWGKVEDALREYFDTKVAEVAPRTGVRAEDIRDWLEYGLVTEQGIRGTVREGQESEFDLNMACVGN